MAIRPVILCGGTGTRLWPASRKDKPKQFLSLLNEETLLETTIKRVESLGAPVLLSNIAFKEYLPDYPVIFEPSGRDTGPACIVASLMFDPEEFLLFVPSDHHIVEEHIFTEHVLKGKIKAQEGKIVVFGILPTRPETGFGYIKYNDDGTVESFLEKPSLEVAEQLIKQNTLWNAGLLFFQVKHFLANCEEVCPEYLALCRQAITGKEINEHYHTLPKISIDHLFNEKCKQMVVEPLPCTWSDIGSWPAIWDLREKDSQENSGNGIFISSTRNLVRSKKTVVMMDLHDHCVVEEDDVILVFPLSSAQKIKDLVKLVPNGLI